MKKTKFSYILLFIISICFFIQNNLTIDNDFYFTVAEGKYVLSNGFPSVVPFTIYDNLDFVYQSWGTGVIFYLIHNYLGNYGMYLFVLIIYLLITYFYYKLCMLVSGNKSIISAIVTIATMCILSVCFITTRPQIFTYLNLTILLYLMELYVKTNNKKYLFPLPIISLMQSNIHGMFFFMLLIFMLPYVVDAFKTDKYKLKHIIITMIIMILTGLINPYGIKNLLYVFNSYGQSVLEENILELHSLSFSDYIGKAFIAIILLLYILYFKSNKKIKIRYLLLLFGTTYLAFDTYRGFALFILASFFPLSYLYNNLIPDINFLKFIPKKLINIFIIITIILLPALFIVTPNDNYIPSKKAIEYLVNNYNIDDIGLYINFNDGSYAVYRGLKCNIDPRAEVYLKKNNHKSDIISEYYSLQKKNISYKKYLDKYKFTHLVIEENDSMYKKLKKDSYNYTLIKSFDKYNIYVRNDLLN